ncbi:MAG TPA: hypothetical protein VJZ93_02575 [Candidatus Nanoarchaeia archaeon]|nr:hypothetical protein [Candidatus Nanoarchaeia archaeon]
MVTTIQLKENVKKILDGLKDGKETYEEVILKIINNLEEQKRKNVDFMIEGAKETAEESLKITKRWEGALLDGLDKNEKW